MGNIAEIRAELAKLEAEREALIEDYRRVLEQAQRAGDRVVGDTGERSLMRIDHRRQELETELARLAE